MKRVLLDENLPRLLARELSGFEVRPVQDRAYSTKLEDLLPLVPEALEALGTVLAGQVSQVGSV